MYSEVHIWRGYLRSYIKLTEAYGIENSKAAAANVEKVAVAGFGEALAYLSDRGLECSY